MDVDSWDGFAPAPYASTNVLKSTGPKDPSLREGRQVHVAYEHLVLQMMNMPLTCDSAPAEEIMGSVVAVALCQPIRPPKMQPYSARVSHKKQGTQISIKMPVLASPHSGITNPGRLQRKCLNKYGATTHYPVQHGRYWCTVNATSKARCFPYNSELDALSNPTGMLGTNPSSLYGIQAAARHIRGYLNPQEGPQILTKIEFN